MTLLQSYYNAINRRAYERAYSYWETPPGNASLAAYTSGYANTASVRVFVGLSEQMGGAAGNIYMEIPTLLVATNTDGSQQMFAGCYVVRRSNIQATGEPLEQAWTLYSASITAVADFGEGLARLTQRCVG